MNCNDKIKLFQPIPLRNSIIPHYITLDANGVLSTFKEDGETSLGYKVSENKEKIWNMIFNTKNKILNNFIFVTTFLYPLSLYLLMAHLLLLLKFFLYFQSYLIIYYFLELSCIWTE